ncbi:MAG: ABC transporter permease [Methylococcales bacterium]|nr:ABC transporter permease [Methylococcales bacterium]
MNPEFQRQLYLEFSLSRVIGMPIFLGVIFSFAYLLNDKQADEGIAYTALGLYTLLVLFWGAKQAAMSMIDELNNNTWDIQKTSAISAWSLTWGKLLGSTLFTWYGGIICLIIYMLATPEPEYIILNGVYFLGSGLLAQSISLLMSLFSVRQKNRSNNMSYLFILIILSFIIPLMFNSHDIKRESVVWYGESYNLAYFVGVSLILACLWSVMGIYRLLSTELRIRTLPSAWLAFISFLIIYLTGFFISNDDPQINLFMGIVLASFCVGISVSYLGLLIDDNSPLLVRKLWIYSQQHQWLRVLQEIPCWMVSVIFVLPATIFLTIFYSVQAIEELYLHPLVIYLLLLRDIAILLYFSYSLNSKRVLGLTLLYLICLYGLLPAIFISAELEWVAGIILPILNENLIIALVIASLQTSFIGILLFQRWQERVMNIKAI